MFWYFCCISMLTCWLALYAACVRFWLSTCNAVDVTRVNSRISGEDFCLIQSKLSMQYSRAQLRISSSCELIRWVSDVQFIPASGATCSIHPHPTITAFLTIAHPFWMHTLDLRDTSVASSSRLSILTNVFTNAFCSASLLPMTGSSSDLKCSAYSWHCVRIIGVGMSALIPV